MHALQRRLLSIYRTILVFCLMLQGSGTYLYGTRVAFGIAALYMIMTQVHFVIEVMVRNLSPLGLVIRHFTWRL